MMEGFKQCFSLHVCSKAILAHLRSRFYPFVFVFLKFGLLTCFVYVFAGFILQCVFAWITVEVEVT